MVSKQNPVGQARQRVVEGIVDELRLKSLPVGGIDQQAL
jgi:hypothetical protein